MIRRERRRSVNPTVQPSDEIPVVAKTARVVEEVVVGKQGANRSETVNETLRGTDVEIEDATRGTRDHGTVESGTSSRTTGSELPGTRKR